MQLPVVRTSSVNSREDWQSFSKEMSGDFKKASLKLGRRSKRPNRLYSTICDYMGVPHLIRNHN